MKTLSLEDIQARFAQNEDVCHRVIDLFSAMSNKNRFRILCMLAHGDYCVHDIADVVQEGKTSNISQHLRLLTLSGYLEKRRDQKNIIYHLKDAKIRRLIQYLEKSFLAEGAKP